VTDPLFGTYFSRNYTQGELIEIDDQLKFQAQNILPPKDVQISISPGFRLYDGWIPWKNHRLTQLGFYFDQDPPKRKFKTSEAPPRLVLREDAHQNTNVPAKPDFLSPGHLEFKFWIQNKIEEAQRGRASPRFLSDHLPERELAMDKWTELATHPSKGIRAFLDKELFDNQKIDEVRHLQLMQKILGRKNPFEGAEELDSEFHRANNSATTRTFGLIDKICRELVRILISQSKTTNPSDEDVYWTVDDAGNHDKILELAGNNGIVIQPRHVNRHIWGNLKFHHYGKYDHKKFAQEVKRLGLTHVKYREKIKMSLTIVSLVDEKVPPLDDWKYSIIWLPGMVFGKKLKDKLSEILLEALAEVKEIANVSNQPDVGDEAKLFDDQLGLTPEEQEDLKRLTFPKVWDSEQKKFVDNPGTNEHPKDKQGGFGSRRGYGKENSPEEATKHNAIKLVGNILMILQEEGIIDHRPMSDQEYRLYYYEGDETKKRPKWSQPNLLYFTEKLKSGDQCSCSDKSACFCFSGITKSNYSHFNERKEHPIYRWLRGERDRWMYSPPEVHKMEDTPVPGGLLVEELRRITTRSNVIYEDEFDTPRCKPNQEILDAMNTLQDTQWEINLHLLVTLFDITLVGGANLSEHPVSEWKTVKKKLIKKIQPKGKFSDVFYHKNKTNDKTNQDRDLMLDWMRRLIDHNANVFWHSWVCDSTGRLYPRCSSLSPQGNDTSKAMIRFKHWKPLGEDGIYWLHVHVQNLMQDVENDSWKGKIAAGKKQTFDEKNTWVIDNRAELRRIAKDPSGYAALLELNVARKPKSEVFQRLAAILELDRVYTVWEKNGEDWSKVTSGLPVHLDASCNGYQHVSTLLRDRNLAKLVNVVGEKGEPPNDFYQKVADEAKRQSGGPDGEVGKFVEEVLFDELTKGQYRWITHPIVKDAKGRSQYRSGSWRIPIHRNWRPQFMEKWDAQVKATIKQIFTRSVVKKPIIIRAYGGTDFAKCLAGRGGEGLPRRRSVSKTGEEREDDKKTLSEMPKPYRKCLTRLMHTHDRRERKELKEKLNKMSVTFADVNQPKEWENALREDKSLFIWNEGSALQQALVDSKVPISAFDVPIDLNEKEILKQDKEKEKFDIRSRRQNELTRLMTKAIKDAIKKITNGAFEDVEKPLKRLARKASGLHPGVQWYLPQDGTNRFEVNHYKIKEFQSDESRVGNPLHPGAVYRARMPDWYKNDMTHTNIQKRLQELYDQSIFTGGVDGRTRWFREHTPIAEAHRKRQVSQAAARCSQDFEELKGTKGEKKYKAKAKAFLEKYSPTAPNEDIEEIRKILSHFEISLLRYHEDESERIDYDKDKVEKKASEFSEKHGRDPTEPEMADLRAKNHKLASSLPPNFIHSLDSFHMRRTINKLKQSISSSNHPQLSFWSVHDAFGTHACDVAKMREAVRQTFHQIHDEIDFDDWIKPKPRNPQLDLSDILDSDYIIS
jgi:DNA-binding GntR family transcriptional regulator